MARSKLRKSNSALSRGQMVRIENRFTLRLEEDTYDPDAIGTCCTANADGEKCVCADNVTARECCEQKGDFKEGESCSNDPCPCIVTGACCVPCDTVFSAGTSALSRSLCAMSFDRSSFDRTISLSIPCVKPSKRFFEGHQSCRAVCQLPWSQSAPECGLSVI